MAGQIILLGVFIGFFLFYLLPVGGDTKEAMREHRMDDFRGLAVTVLLFLLLLFLKMFDKIF